MRRWREWPWVLIAALVSAAVGFSLAAGGVNALFGSGWAMLVGSVPFLLLSAVIMRGL